MQSRYYDPELGRFLNADAFTSTGQGLLGNNMFAYCNNNPVLNYDPGGYRFAPAIAVYEEREDDLSSSPEAIPAGTLSLGMSFSIGVGPWAVGAQGCITIDTAGYVAIQYGTSGGLSADPGPAGFSASATPYAMISNAPSYRGLEGPGVQIGGSRTPVTVDYNAMLDETGQTILYHGITVGAGATTSGVHVMWGNTYTLVAVKFDWDTYNRIIQY